MRLLEIIVDPLEIRGEIQVVHPTGVTNPEQNEEMGEEISDQTTLPFPR